MADEDKALVPVWTLAADDVRLPTITDDAPITPERLAELRGVLAALAASPIATLEVHPLPEKVDRSQGIVLGSTSPLAHHLSQLIAHTMTAAPAAEKIGTSGETLYRMVVPAKVLRQARELR